MTDRMTTAADLWPLQSRHLRPDVDVRAALPQGGVVPAYTIGKPQWSDRTPQGLAEYHTLSTTLFACVSYRANAVASATARVYDAATREPDDRHEIRTLLQNPNPEQSEAEFLALVQMVGDIAGFAPIQKVRSNAGRVVQLWLLRPDWCRPILRDQAPADWEYRVPGSKEIIVMPSEDMIVYTPAPALDRSPTGVAPAGVALRELGIERAMTDFLAVLFQRGALPFIALLPSEDTALDTSSAEALKSKFGSKYGGAKNWAEPVILEGIKSIERMGYDLNELAYNDLRGLTEVGICQAFGVPPSLINANVGLEHSIYNNVSEARLSFYQDTVDPLWKRLDGALSRGLIFELARPGLELGFDTSDVPALSEDEDKLWERANSGVVNGWIKVNEARSMVGFEDAEDGDLFLRPAQPVAFDVGDATRQIGESLGVSMAQSLTRSATDYRDAIATTGFEVRTIGGIERRYLPVTETRAKAAETSRKRARRLADKFTPKLAAFWAEQGERVIGGMTTRCMLALSGDNGVQWQDSPEWERQLRTEASGSVARSVLGLFPNEMPIGRKLETRDIAEPMIGWDDERQALELLIGGFHGDVSEAAFDAALETLGIDGDGVSWDLSNPNIANVLEQLGLRITDIAETTRADVQRVVGEALENGETVDQLADRLKALFTETYKGRAETVARTESMNAYNLASATGYRESGIVDYLQLLDSPTHTEDYGASDGLTCASRNRLVVRLEDAAGHIAAEHINGQLSIAPIAVGSEGDA